MAAIGVRKRERVEPRPIGVHRPAEVGLPLQPGTEVPERIAAKILSEAAGRFSEQLAAPPTKDDPVDGEAE